MLNNFSKILKKIFCSYWQGYNLISYQKNLLCYQNKSSIRNYSKTVKSEVINVEFLSRDLPLNNSVIMVKWKCLKLLYSSKEMYWIDSQSKKLIHLKYLILETLKYTFFSIFSWYFSFTHTEHSIICIFRYLQQQPFLFWRKGYR